jgi:hypothetical protein
MKAAGEASREKKQISKTVNALTQNAEISDQVQWTGHSAFSLMYYNASFISALSLLPRYPLSVQATRRALISV